MLSGFLDQTEKPAGVITSFSDAVGEEVLVAAARDGDEEAFGVLVERHHQRVLAVALRYTRVREDAEDIAQQTFQKAFVYLPRFEGKSSFSTWLTRIVINEALMLLRRGRALREVTIESGTQEEDSRDLESADSRPDPEATYLQREAARILSAAMHKLAPGVRKAIELRELGELSTRETAQRMGLSVSAVKARLFHGKRELRKTLRRLQIAPKAIFNN